MRESRAPSQEGTAQGKAQRPALWFAGQAVKQPCDTVQRRGTRTTVRQHCIGPRIVVRYDRSVRYTSGVIAASRDNLNDFDHL